MSVQILEGDSLTVLRALPDESVHCCVTSPPYFGLRKYGDDAAELGQETTPAEFVENLVLVFREVRRVLRDDGTLWVNIGDSYATRGGANQTPQTGDIFQRRERGKQVIGRSKRMPRGEGRWGGGNASAVGEIKPKDLIGIPWMLAFALRADGWYLRQDIIWKKPNPMPESVADRCTKSHEYLFLFAKSGSPTIWRARDTKEWNSSPDLSQRLPDPRDDDPDATIARWRSFDYYYDKDAISEPLGMSSIQRLSQENLANQSGSDRVPGKTNGAMKAVGRRAAGNKTHKGQTAYESGDGLMRTKAGLVSFAERERAKVEAGDLVGARNKRSVWTVTTQPFKEAHFATFPPALVEPCILAGSPVGGTVLDCFGGSGTTGMVADRLQRDAILIDLYPKFTDMSRKRIVGDSPLFVELK